MKKVGIILVLSILCVGIFADESAAARTEIPLISSSSKVLFNEDFRRMTELIAKSDEVSGHETARFAMPYSSKNSLVLWNLSYGYFFPLTDWLYLPLYGSLAAGYGYGPAGYGSNSLTAGTGFVFDFEYVAIGTSVDFSLDLNTAILDDIQKYIKPGFGLYPVFNTGKFPSLSILEKIAGEFTVTDTESPDAVFESAAWATKLVFRYLFNIPVFEPYVKSGKNDFFPEYDLSETYTGFKSLTYGCTIGTETLSIEVNYTTITGAFLMGKDAAIADDQKKMIHYPFGLNGFPALTIHWRPDETYWYLRLSTIQGMLFLSEDEIKKYPVIPTLGVALPSFDFFGGKEAVLLGSFTIPFVATMALQMYL
jgi:hypothetical protein